MATKYSQWAPTRFDTRGLGLEDRQDWYVVPLCQTRDSGILERSNFRSALRILAEQGTEHEVHRFGHWGPGWVEIILTPDESAADALDCSDYPVLDDTDHSNLQSEEEGEQWENFNSREWAECVARETGCARAVALLSVDDLGTLHLECSDGPEYDDEGPRYTFARDVRKVKRASVARLALFVRAEARARRLGYTVYAGTHLRAAAYAVLSPLTYERQHTGRDLTAPGVKVCRAHKSLLRALCKMESRA